MTVYDRWHLSFPPDAAEPCRCGRGKNKLYPSADHGRGKRWQVQWIDDTGAKLKRNFAKKGGGRDEIDPETYAEAWDARVNADLDADSYIDPNAGKTTFKAYAEEVLSYRTLDPGTRTNMRQRLAKHVYPLIGHVELRTLSKRPTRVQAVIAHMEKAGLSPGYIKIVMAHVSVVFASAVDDEKIGKNPMKSQTVRPPTVTRKKVKPWPYEDIDSMREELPEEFEAMVDVGAGLGLRQGEIFGLSPDDVDWLTGEVAICRQVKIVDSKRVFGLPKYEKVRTIPLPESVKLVLAEHMRRHPPVEVALPWREPKGDPRAVRLFFTTARGDALHRSTFNRDVWFPACERAGIVPPPIKDKEGSFRRDKGMHGLRHYFASALLTAGEAVQAVSEWMGHHSPTITWDIYAHLMPQSESRMKKLIDSALRPPDETQSAREVPAQKE